MAEQQVRSALFGLDGNPKDCTQTFYFICQRIIINGHVKSSNGVCTLTISDDVADWKVEFREGTGEYLREKIKVGDYLKLNVIEKRRTVTLKG